MRSASTGASVLSGTCVLASLLIMSASAFMNFTYLSSIGKTAVDGHTLGVISIAFDMLKSGLPFFIAWGLGNRKWLVALLGSIMFCGMFCFSLSNEIGYLATNRMAMSGARAALNTDLAAAQGDLAAIEKKLAAVETHRSSGVIDEDVSRLKQDKRFTASAACTNATATASRDYCASFFTLQRELAAAVEAAGLEAEKTRLRSHVAVLEGNGAGQEVDAQASLFARVLPSLPADRAVIAWAVGVAVIIELGAAFGLYLSTGWRPSEDEAGPEPQYAELVPVPIVPKGGQTSGKHLPAPPNRNALPRRDKLRRITFGEDGSLLLDDD